MSWQTKTVNLKMLKLFWETNLFLLRDKLEMKRNLRIQEKVQLPKIPIKQNIKNSETSKT